MHFDFFILSALTVLLICCSKIILVQSDVSGNNQNFARNHDGAYIGKHDDHFLRAVSEFQRVRSEQLSLGAANDPSARLLVFTIGVGVDETSNHLLVRLGFCKFDLRSLD
jgi:hypothetical protein